MLIVAISCKRPLLDGMRVSLATVDGLLIGRGTGSPVASLERLLVLTIDDDAMSSRHTALRRKLGGWELEDLGSKNGTFVNGTAQVRTMLKDGDVIEMGATMLLFCDASSSDAAALGPTILDLRREDPSNQPPGFRTLAPAMESLLSEARRMAAQDVPVLVRGESGTGKELMARAFHQLSRRGGEFVPVNCGALPRSLIESELFGFRNGAFSGAREDREGLARSAHRGTLFLDEVAELPTESQVALLRLLQEGEVRPVGSDQTFYVDVRVIAATHQDLVARVAAGDFRNDLYARLAGFQLPLPPLRERREDIGLLTAALLRKRGAQAANVTLHREAARALLRYPYPLNVRELEQALGVAVGLAEGGQILPKHLPALIRDYQAGNANSRRAKDEATRGQVVAALAETGGNMSAAARLLGKAPVQIQRWCRRLDIDPKNYK